MKRMEARTRCAASVAVVIALLGAGCSAGSDASRTTEPSDASGAWEAPSEPTTYSEQVDIGGRSLHMECWGDAVAGEPTVLLIAGQGPPLSYWAPMARQFAAESHHLCAYDRAGVGSSDPPPESSRTTADQVADLIALLDGARLEEPVVVVAHSRGSLPAVGLVAQAAERVAGIVLVDPHTPRLSTAQRAALPAESPDESPEVAEERRYLDEVMFDPAQDAEHLLLAECDEEIAALLDEPGPIFGELPVIVLESPPLPYLAGLPPEYHEVTLAAISDGHREFAAESTRGIVVAVDDTGHDIHVDRPDVVIDAIREVIAG
ncbi:alpha/beta fold hydrolase [Agromyces flavus]|nr:alpha/beta hydrolase [Agromyces flavus]GGI45940.1 hydrolase or acyltransferase of alpha/beta superfamily protein [Agromyces flavus]